MLMTDMIGLELVRPTSQRSRQRLVCLPLLGLVWRLLGGRHRPRGFRNARSMLASGAALVQPREARAVGFEHVRFGRCPVVVGR